MVKHEINGKFINILLEAEFFWSHVQKPTKKAKGDGEEYQVTLFLSPEDAKELVELGLNKTLYKVGRDKKKIGKNKGDIKYPEDVYPVGKVGLSVSSPTHKRDGSPIPAPKVLCLEGGKKKIFGGLVGNGSTGKVLLFGYKNEDDLWNVRLKTMLVEEPVEYGGSTLEDELLKDVEPSSLADEMKEEEEEGEDEDGDFEDDEAPF